MATDDTSTEVFNQMVRDSIIRRLKNLDGDELLNILGFMIQRERRKSADERVVGLYPIQANADSF